jgi:cathepsin D
VFSDRQASYLGEVPDGILGMAPTGLAAFDGAKPFFQTLVDEGQLKEPVFGLSLAEPNPVVVLGGRDKSRFKGDLKCTAVEGYEDGPVRISRGVPCLSCLHINTDTIQPYWRINLDEIAVNGKNISLELLPVADKLAFIDSDSVQVLGPRDAIVEFYKNIPGSTPLESSEVQYTCTLSPG